MNLKCPLSVLSLLLYLCYLSLNILICKPSLNYKKLFIVIWMNRIFIRAPRLSYILLHVLLTVGHLPVMKD